MDQDTPLSWSRFYSYRREIRRSYPSIYGIRIRKKLLDVVLDELEDSARVLDVGAHDKTLGEKIVRHLPSVIYKTMDIDRARPHDYYDLDDIHETYDMIILSEVIEHIAFGEGLSLLRRLQGLLNDTGKMVISTPNMHHPNRWWDLDHKTTYRYDELGASLLSVSFKVNKIFRIYNDRFFKRLFRLYIASPLHEYLDVDFAKSIVVVAGR